jgi:radical SAM superfamily enzyme YgiQ (UPF0313 family)
VAYRSKDGRIAGNTEYQIIGDLDSIPSPYTPEMLEASKRRSLIYLEGSRGCPFSCGYCLSSAFRGVRRFSLNRIADDFHRIVAAGYKNIKFVDRTFNCDRKYAVELLNLAGSIDDKDVCVHFEAAGDLFDAGLFDAVAKLPPGRVKFEIGIQSMNKKTLEASGRKIDTALLSDNIRKLISIGNANIHVDLIAGLPFEDMDSFRKSFNEVYSLKAHHIQVGFLKLLKGTDMRNRSEELGIVYRDRPPYEVLSGKDLSAGEILLLKKIAEAVERFYNSGHFATTIETILSEEFSGDPFTFYEKLADILPESGKLPDLYAALMILRKDGKDTDSLIFDFFRSNPSKCLPACLLTHRRKIPLKTLGRFYADPEMIRKYLPGFIACDPPVISHLTQIERIGEHEDLYLFDYSGKDPVTGLYPYQIIESGDLTK